MLRLPAPHLRRAAFGTRFGQCTRWLFPRRTLDDTADLLADGDKSGLQSQCVCQAIARGVSGQKGKGPTLAGLAPFSAASTCPAGEFRKYEPKSEIVKKKSC